MKFPEQFRCKNGPVAGYASSEGDPFGIFHIPARYANGRPLNIIAADGKETGWDHVSVSVSNSKKCPSWEEMCIVKKLFWDGSECVIQFHPPEEDYVNMHPGVLHLWKSLNQEFPMPPKICV